MDLRINICRGQISGTNFLKHGISDSMNFQYALENGGNTTAQATELLGIKQRRAREILVNGRKELAE